MQTGTVTHADNTVTKTVKMIDQYLPIRTTDKRFLNFPPTPKKLSDTIK